MADESLESLLTRLQTEEVRFLYKLNWILNHVLQENHPEHAQRLAIGWVSGYNAFYCNTAQLAQILNLGRDSVTKNFQHLGFRFVKKPKIPLNFGDQSGWKIRYHPDITTDCNERIKSELSTPYEIISSTFSTILFTSESFLWNNNPGNKR
jgi:hypothetical protein